MRKIKAKNTTPEIILRKILWKEGIRYRIENKKITGNPDIAIKKHKIAIFVDGEFWHGFNWYEKKTKIKSNREYWIRKIERNIERDKKYNQLLIDKKWIVLRFWEQEIKKDLNKCIEIVKDTIASQSSSLAGRSKSQETTKTSQRACLLKRTADRNEVAN
ncbi:MAG: very short patch repair endonuclease [Bacteroidetes bacterium HGW-Bacteroidetes-17]|nr:MAG: very short patch repair endonuclease [Bacteroidetes bacterium HGW-Bacteroidetes-17]